MLQTTGKPFVIRFDRVVAAYRAVKANKGSHGVDDVSLDKATCISYGTA